MAGKLSLNAMEALIVDMDGVLWVGDRPLEGLVSFFDFLGETGLPFVMATNNASRTPEHYVDKLAAFGVRIDARNVLTSALATADWLSGELEPGARVYCVGQEGLRAALGGAGFAVQADARGDVDAVVAGIDFTLTYQKLRDAVLLIGRGARFIGTNGDLTYPCEDGLAPGGGAIVAAIEAASGVTPTIVGKPNRPMFDAAVARLGAPRSATLMVGDRLETDILGGRRAGMKTVLITTGVDTTATVREKAIIPDAIFDNLGALTRAWRAEAAQPSGR